MYWLTEETGQVPIILSLTVLVVGLYFRGTILWASVAVVLCFLLVVDRESIVTLVVYAFSALLVIAGYRRIRLGLATPQTINQASNEASRGEIVLDANNLLGLVKWEINLLKEFVNELESDGFSVHLFFDHNVHRLLKKQNLIKSTETIPMALCRIMEMNRHKITVSKKGHKADALLVRHADRNNLIVLSNDRFKKKSEDRFYLDAAARLSGKGLIKRVGLVHGRLTVM